MLFLMAYMYAVVVFGQETTTSYVAESYIHMSGQYYQVSGPSVRYSGYVPYDVQIGLKTIQFAEISRYVSGEKAYDLTDSTGWSASTSSFLGVFSSHDSFEFYDSTIVYCPIGQEQVSEIIGQEKCKKAKAMRLNGPLWAIQIGGLPPARAYANIGGEVYELRSPPFEHSESNISSLREYQECYILALFADLQGEKTPRCLLADYDAESVRMTLQEGSYHKANLDQVLEELGLDSIDQLTIVLLE